MNTILGTLPTYKPGQTVPISGIYTVTHDRHHVATHEITAVRGEPFPPCNNCGHGIRYQLARAAKHLSEHPLLT